MPLTELNGTVRSETDTTLARICELLPSVLAQGACKVAGLPKPTGRAQGDGR
jgi:sulfur relay (sulfurtransferase) DsrC/TusE family protein